jgi:hypothetical protein
MSKASTRTILWVAGIILSLTAVGKAWADDPTPTPTPDPENYVKVVPVGDFEDNLYLDTGSSTLYFNTQNGQGLKAIKVLSESLPGHNRWKVSFTAIVPTPTPEPPPTVIDTMFYEDDDESVVSVSMEYSITKTTSGHIDVVHYDLGGNTDTFQITLKNDEDVPTFNSFSDPVYSSDPSRIDFSFSVSDTGSGVLKTELYLVLGDNDVLIGTNTEPEDAKHFTWYAGSTLPGNYTFYAKAYDRVGNTKLSSPKTGTVGQSAAGMIYGSAANEHLGGSASNSVAFGDINGDGYDDLVMGL